MANTQTKALTPYSYHETAKGWAVQRLVGTKDPSTNVTHASLEVESTYPAPYEAIEQCYELNGRHMTVHPLDALLHLFVMATQESHSGSSVAAQVLLGLYNGFRFKFDLTELRRLDGPNLQACLALIEFDANPKMEVHQWLNLLTARDDMGQRFEWMAWRHKLMDEKPEGALPPPLALVSPLGSNNA